MDYPQTKVYFDGSHYIGIPHTTQPWKRKKTKDKVKNEQQEKVKEIYKSLPKICTAAVPPVPPMLWVIPISAPST